MKIYIILSALLLMPSMAMAHSSANDLTGHGLAITSLAVFVLGYLAVIFEEKLHLRKSKPMMLAAGIIWVLISLLAQQQGLPQEIIHSAVMYGLEEYAALLLFLLVAMTYINVMEERGVFNALRSWLIGQGYSYRQLFWGTGSMAFFISPLADNLTTALVMGTVIIAVGKDEPKFVIPALINVVVGANAGGAFSPFGDITTLMVWQAGNLPFPLY